MRSKVKDLLGDNMSFVKATVAAIAVSATSATTAAARDQVHIAGSSTVLPYASIQIWPSGQMIELGRADYHGRWIDWSLTSDVLTSG